MVIGSLRTAKYLANPNKLKNEVINFVERGVRKNLLTNEGSDEVIDALRKNNFIKEGQTVVIRKVKS